MNLSPAERSHDHLSNDHLPRQVARRLDASYYHGLETAARVNAAAYVTHTAMSLTGQLTAMEEQLIKMVPLGENRYRAIVDQFTLHACREISRM